MSKALVFSSDNSPFVLDEVERLLAAFGDPLAIARTASALNSGIAYAASQAVQASGDDGIDVTKVVLGMRRHFGLPDSASSADSPFSIPLIDSLLKSSVHGESHVRGLLRETARAVVSDMVHSRAPRRGLLKRLLTSLTATR